MLNDALIIFRKELGNVFKDKRAVFANFVLPLFLMTAIFASIGMAQSFQSSQNRETVFSIAFVNEPSPAFGGLLRNAIDETGLKYTIGSQPLSVDGLTLTFPAGWDGITPGRNTELSFDTSRQDLQFAAGKVKEAINKMNENLAAERLSAAGLQAADLKPVVLIEKSLAIQQTPEAPFAATILPYMIIIMVFAGSMGLGMTATAGEKENGSLASLLVNQVSRSSIALGKVFAIMVMSLVNAVMNGIGIIIGISVMSAAFANDPSVAQAAGSEAANQAGLLGVIGQPGTIIVLFLSLLLTSAVAATVMVYLGTLAKNIKEASGYIMPVYILVIVGALFTMNMDVSRDMAMYLIPVINVVFLLKSAILSTVELLPLLLTAAINLTFAGVLVALIAKEFNSERVLYSS